MTLTPDPCRRSVGALAISLRTLDTYRNRLLEKLGLRSVADVVRWVVQRGMVG